MKIIGITGYSGFVGANLIPYLDAQNQFSIREINLRNNPDFSSFKEYDAFIHLAGKAHDLKKTVDPGEYYRVNTDLTKQVFDAFINSKARKFIMLSSVKAVADKVSGILTEETFPNPETYYGKSKLLAEKYIFSKELPKGKSIYILRPCMIHGPGNKGNLNLLYKLISKGIPYPLAAFENKRSFLSIENLCAVIKELLERDDIPSGIFNVADDEALSANEVITILAESQNRKPSIWKISKRLIQFVAKIGNLVGLPLNEERLHKLTDSYVVSNQKLNSVIGKPFPISSKEGLLKTFKSFS
jgi:nucleoside-diphosphate-sugar epimerase